MILRVDMILPLFLRVMLVTLFGAWSVAMKPCDEMGDVGAGPEAGASKRLAIPFAGGRWKCRPNGGRRVHRSWVSFGGNGPNVPFVKEQC